MGAAKTQRRARPQVPKRPGQCMLHNEICVHAWASVKGHLYTCVHASILLSADNMYALSHNTTLTPFPITVFSFAASLLYRSQKLPHH